MGELFNRRIDEAKRRALRRQNPPAEAILWRRVRGNQLGGFKFRRQYSISHYVTDFCCTSSQLIVELDGASHESDDAVEYDLNRQHYLESLGFRVVRFTNRQVYSEIDFVLETLLHLCQSRKDFRLR